MKTISIIIVVTGNPPHLFEVIDSVSDMASELLICDNGFDISTEKKLNTYKKVRIVRFEKKVPYVELIREKLKKMAKSEYVFFLDEDEIVSKELSTFLLDASDQYDYFEIPRKNIIFEKWIQHSRWWPDYQIRFFKKDKVVWPTEIHHQPIVSGTKHTIKDENQALIHYNYDSIDQYLLKAIRYAKAESREYVAANKSFTLKEACQKALSEFMSRYFAFEGYKDGMHGFVLSFMQMMYYFLVFFYYWEEKKYFALSETELLNESTAFFKKGFKESHYWINQKSTGLGSKIKNKIISHL
jgi:(heptosyl)LPS beta-1,4-glucosyltransferase